MFLDFTLQDPIIIVGAASTKKVQRLAKRFCVYRKDSESTKKVLRLFASLCASSADGWFT